MKATVTTMMVMRFTFWPNQQQCYVILPVHYIAEVPHWLASHPSSQIVSAYISKRSGSSSSRTLWQQNQTAKLFMLSTGSSSRSSWSSTSICACSRQSTHKHTASSFVCPSEIDLWRRWRRRGRNWNLEWCFQEVKWSEVWYWKAAAPHPKFLTLAGGGWNGLHFRLHSFTAVISSFFIIIVCFTRSHRYHIALSSPKVVSVQSKFDSKPSSWSPSPLAEENSTLWPPPLLTITITRTLSSARLLTWAHRLGYFGTKAQLFSFQKRSFCCCSALDGSLTRLLFIFSTLTAAAAPSSDYGYLLLETVCLPSPSKEKPKPVVLLLLCPLSLSARLFCFSFRFFIFVVFVFVFFFSCTQTDVIGGCDLCSDLRAGLAAVTSVVAPRASVCYLWGGGGLVLFFENLFASFYFFEQQQQRSALSFLQLSDSFSCRKRVRVALLSSSSPVLSTTYTDHWPVLWRVRKEKKETSAVVVVVERGGGFIFILLLDLLMVIVCLSVVSDRWEPFLCFAA